MKKTLYVTLALTALVLSLSVAVSAEGSTWTGEVVDVACYVAQGAQGSGHADCAKKCVQAGQPMGLLTEDGELILLAADHADGAPFEALKEMAGSQAKVSGQMAEKDGVKMVTVTGAEAA